LNGSGRGDPVSPAGVRSVLFVVSPQGAKFNATVGRTDYNDDLKSIRRRRRCNSWEAN